MKIDITMLKLVFITLAMQLVALAKNNSQRWIVREWFTKGEIPFLKWFQIDFLLHLSTQQILGLGIIAAFTFVTFPLGIWMGSFGIGKSYSIMNIVGAAVNLITFPLAIHAMVNVLGELELNRTTWIGIWLIVASKLIIMAGCWLMYIGNNGGTT